MKYLKVVTAILVLVLFVVSPAEVFTQQRRQPPKPIRKTVSPPAATPTFDTLLGADTFNLYLEVRGVGQLIRSNSVNELLEPVMKLADPPKEFKTLIKWLNTHADDVMTSRMFVAAWPIQKNLPEALVAIEFDSTEEAAKFEPQLNNFLPKVLPTPTPQESPSPEAAGTVIAPNPQTEPNSPPKPTYYLKQVGSLILITPTPLNLKALRSSKSKLLTEDPGFRVARSRFVSEQFFAYIDIKGIKTESENRIRQSVEEEQKQAEERAKQVAISPPVEAPKEVEEKKDDQEQQQEAEVNTELMTPPEQGPPTPPPPPDPMSLAVGMLANSFFKGEPKYPDAIGIGVAFENDSFDLRALLLSAPGEKCDPIPFFPSLIPGPQITSEASSILPADTEFFASVSLDLPQIYALMAKQQIPDDGDSAEIRTISATEGAGPFAELEKQLKLKVKDDILPLLGSELVITIPLKMLDDGPIPSGVVAANPPPNSKEADKKSPEPSVIVALSLKDKEGVRLLLPKIVDSLGFKGASALAQTERHDNVELVSYASAFSYAFIDNFLVLSADASAIRHVVDSYLKHETLASDTQFRNYTRWHPRQLQGQVYISPALMESYKTWANQPSTLISDQMREILSRLSLVAQPVTYSLSNDGLGTMHEVHVPKNLLLMAVAGLASESNPSPIVQNERSAMGALAMISNAEIRYHSGKGRGSFGTMDQLFAEGLLAEGFLNHGYKIELTLVGSKFEVTAVPDEYGKTGRNSYFVDHTNVLRGGDHGGSAATADDDPIH
jgi:hypothetical protein